MDNKREEKIAGTIGTVGTAVSIGVITAGSSASAMTAGLASVGALVGGGMGTGIAVVAAAPLVVGVAAFGAVSATKWLFENW